MRAQLFAVFLLLTEVAMTPDEDLGQFIITVLCFFGYTKVIRKEQQQTRTLLSVNVGSAQQLFVK